MKEEPLFGRVTHWKFSYIERTNVLSLHLVKDGLEVIFTLDNGQCNELYEILHRGLPQETRIIHEAIPHVLGRIRRMINYRSGISIECRRELSKMMFEEIGEVVNYSRKKRPRKPVK